MLIRSSLAGAAGTPVPPGFRFRVALPATQPLVGASRRHGWRHAERRGVRGVVVLSVCPSLSVGCRIQCGSFGTCTGGSRSAAKNSKAFHGAQRESTQTRWSIRLAGSVGVSGWLQREPWASTAPRSSTDADQSGLRAVKLGVRLLVFESAVSHTRHRVRIFENVGCSD
jgi:hypothetical protein